MKVSLNWLKKLTKVDLTTEQLIDKIGAQLGAVEEVIDNGARYKGIIAVRVVACTPHPNADKLRLCHIDVGGDPEHISMADEQGNIQVVCGAPNVATGQLVAWIPPNAIVPCTYGNKPLTIESRDIRGVTSNGMLASTKELDLGEDHSGILVMSGDIKPGTPIAEIYDLNDIIIDIENKMFTHRPDCFGMLGIAREVAGIQNLGFKSPDWYNQALQISTPASNLLPLEVTNEIPELVSRFMAVAMAQVTVQASPLWLQGYLLRLGVKPVNNVVDLTNYYMILTGQPLHAYDYDKLLSQDPGAKVATLNVRYPSEGEELKLLGGRTIKLYKEAIVIASANRVVGLGGVMGGANTEVDINTKNIVIECAHFDMYSIRRVMMQQGIFTDASTRFTKNQSPLQNDKILLKIVDDIQKSAGGHIASEVFDLSHDLLQPASVYVTESFINQRLGLSLTVEEIATRLINVEFTVNVDGDSLRINVPFWRTDIGIAEDIVEEVGRLMGYDQLPIELPTKRIDPAPLDSMLSFKSHVRSVLSRGGANEALTYSFVHGDLIKKVGQDSEQAFRLANALSPSLQYFRLSLLPSLLEKVHPNIKSGYEEFALFEINQAHTEKLVDEKQDGLPVEQHRLALIFTANDKFATDRYWGAAYYQARKYLDFLMHGVGIKITFQQAETYKSDDVVIQQILAPFCKQRSAIIGTEDGIFLGIVGEISQSARRNLKLPNFTAGFEVDMSKLLKLWVKGSPYTPLPRFPKVTQDISLQVNDNNTTYDAVYKTLDSTINESKPEKTTYSLRPLDIYKKSNDSAERHMTFRLTIASFDRTLKADEINLLLDDAAKQVASKINVIRI